MSGNLESMKESQTVQKSLLNSFYGELVGPNHC